MKETIKEITYFPNYYISDCGNTYSTLESYRWGYKKDQFRPLAQKVNKEGYHFIGAYVNRKKIWKTVHKVVVEHFFGEIPKGMTVDHIDGNKSNNHISNLEVVTRGENTKRYWQRKNGKTN